MLDELVASLFPSRCVGCGGRGDGLCRSCLVAARPAPIAPPPPGCDAFWAPFAYEGPVREAVARLKYRNERAVVRLLGAAMAGGVSPGTRAVVTWAPATSPRRRSRGFDQAEVLARRLARHLGLPARRLLRRVDDRVQTGAPARARRRGPSFAAAARCIPPAVVVVDDVSTTGATLAGAARALRAQGCIWVMGVTAARTPLKHHAEWSETNNGAGGGRQDERMHGSTGEEPLVVSAIEGLKERPVRPSVVQRIGEELERGSYDPPIEQVVDRLISAIVGGRRPPDR